MKERYLDKYYLDRIGYYTPTSEGTFRPVTTHEGKFVFDRPGKPTFREEVEREWIDWVDDIHERVSVIPQGRRGRPPRR